jgi:hypothetical protein
MDLLGRKTRKLLEQVVSRGEQLEGLAHGYKALADLQERIISDLSARVDSRESLLLDYIREANELKNEVLRLKTPALPTPPFRPSQALHMSEEEQELRWREEQGLIKKADLGAMLDQLDFENTEIELDPDYVPRNPTY